MKDAAQSHDADALNAYIDYPALRESLKAELMARMTAEAQKGKSGFGALGMAFGSAIIGPMINILVSPAGMRAALLANNQEDMVACCFSASCSEGAGHCASQLLRVSRDRKEPAEQWARVQEAWPFLDAQRRRIATDRVEVSACVAAGSDVLRGMIGGLVASGGFPPKIAVLRRPKTDIRRRTLNPP